MGTGKESHWKHVSDHGKIEMCRNEGDVSVLFCLNEACEVMNGNHVPVLYPRGDPAQHMLWYEVNYSESTKDDYSLPDCYNCETY